MSRKPIVGVVYSRSTEASDQSLLQARYVACALANTGYALVHLVPFGEGDGAAVPESGSLRFQPPGGGRRVCVGPGLVREVPWAEAMPASLDLVVLCNNPNDSEAVGTALKAALPQDWDKPVFCLQRGVRNGAAVKGALSTHGVTVLDGVAGFWAVEVDSDQTVEAFPRGAGLAIERLSRDSFAIADGPSRLLEHMGHPIVYHKVLTQYSWGVLQLEASHAASALASLPLAQVLGDPHCRLVAAAVLRETYRALAAAARGDRWRPLLTLHTVLPTKAVELMLAAPFPLPPLLRNPLLPLEPTLCPAGAPAPLLADLRRGRSTGVRWSLGELVDTAEAAGSAVPVTKKLLELVEAAAAAGASPALDPEALFRELGSPTASRRELLRWALAAAAVAWAVALLVWLVAL